MRDHYEALLRPVRHGAKEYVREPPASLQVLLRRVDIGQIVLDQLIQLTS